MFTVARQAIARHYFHVLVLERLHLPFPITEAVCEGCGVPVDIHGYHRTACMRTGRVKKRAVPPNESWRGSSEKLEHRSDSFET